MFRGVATAAESVSGKAAQGALAGTRVIELADESGCYCGKLFADMGADVVKVEPPGGDPARGLTPLAPDGSEPSLSSQSRHAAFADCATPVAVPLVTRADLETVTAGPLFIDEYDATIVVPPGWTAKHDAHGNIIMTHGDATS